MLRDMKRTFAIFVIAEIRKIDLEALFFRIKNPHCKYIDLWVRIQIVQKTFSLGIADFTEASF